MGSGRDEERRALLPPDCVDVHLVRQGSPTVGDDGASDRLEEDPVLLRYLVPRSYENAARPIGQIGFDAGGDESHDLVVQQLPVTGVIFVPDHQIHRQSLQAPVGMGLNELAHEIDIGRIFNLQQHDRQIAGDGVSPEAGLPLRFFDQNARFGSKRRIGVEDRTGKAPIELRVGLGDIQLAQQHLAVCPRQIKDAIRQTPILVFFHQAQALHRGSPPMPETMLIVTDSSGSSVIR